MSKPIFHTILCTLPLLPWTAPAAFADGRTLRSGEYSVVQSWSQESDFERPYLINVPDQERSVGMPVLIFLHGNGGSAKSAMSGFLKRNPELSRRYITVFPQGYLKSWNIVSERSKADDLAFVEAIIKSVSEHTNVDGEDVSIMGSSNGAALVNQIAIESRLPNLRNFVTCVSPLNTFQHDGTRFHAKGNDNEYRSASPPTRGRRLMNVSGTEDRLVPYGGGPSPVIPAKDGKLPFVGAEESIFLWAKAMGYKGPKLLMPSSSGKDMEVFSYLEGDVIHYKLIGEGHGATRAISEELLLRFLNNQE